MSQAWSTCSVDGDGSSRTQLVVRTVAEVVDSAKVRTGP